MLNKRISKILDFEFFFYFGLLFKKIEDLDK